MKTHKKKGWQTYTLITPKGAKLIVKAKQLKVNKVRYVPAPFGTGFRPICEHGIETAREGPA